MPDLVAHFWNSPVAGVLQSVESGPTGLSSGEAARRRKSYAICQLRPRRAASDLALLLSQFTNPIILILLFAAGLAFFLADRTDTAIILAIVFMSGLLGFWQERGATRAVERLLSVVRVQADVLRDGVAHQVPVEDIVPGDVVRLRAGDTIPGDCLVMESKELFVDEAALTGETYPLEKMPGILPKETALGRRTNSLFLGTHVVSGTGTAVVVRIGTETEFGKVSQRLKLRPPETEFERGVRRFGYLLLEVTLVLVLAIFSINVFLNRPVLESFLFSLALAVGLTPQLLPAIISINLAHGAKRMATRKVIVKRLASIENFGSMTVFCSDKTGTLTEGHVRLYSALDVKGNPSERVLLCAYLNASYESGFLNPIDEAIRTHRPFDLAEYRKLDEEPYDFIRKRLSILVATQTTCLMLTKGALLNVLDVCASAELAPGTHVEIASVQDSIVRRLERLSEQGFRVLGIAYREMGARTHISKDDETGMIFLGFLAFTDPPKVGIAETLGRLRNLGVSLKILTGDNRLVAAHVARQVGLINSQILTGEDLQGG